MFRKLSLVLTLILSFSLFTACDDDDPAPPTLALEEVEDSYYNLFCEKIETCPMNPYFDLAVNSRDQCLDFLMTQMVEDDGLGRIVDAVVAGTVVYDAELAWACVEEMGALPCDEFGDNEPASCINVFTGTIADGDACDINEECISGYCDTTSGCPGVCAESALVGDACDTTDECEPGAKCILGECQFFALAGVGDECDENEDWCEEGTYCNATTNECTAQLAEGDDCDGGSDNECETGTLCMGIGDGVQATCVMITVVETEGDACDYNAGEMCAMYDDLTCAIDDFDTFTGTCQVTTKLGDVCFDITNMVMTSCDPWADLYCDTSGLGQGEDGTCVAKKVDAADCESDDECLSGWCDETNVCASEEETCK